MKEFIFSFGEFIINNIDCFLLVVAVLGALCLAVVIISMIITVIQGLK